MSFLKLHSLSSGFIFRVDYFSGFVLPRVRVNIACISGSPFLLILYNISISTSLEIVPISQIVRNILHRRSVFFLRLANCVFLLFCHSLFFLPPQVDIFHVCNLRTIPSFSISVCVSITRFITFYVVFITFM